MKEYCEKFYNESQVNNDDYIDKIKEWNFLIHDIIDYFSTLHNTEIQQDHLARIKNHNFVQNLKLSKELCKFGIKTYDLKKNSDYIQAEKGLGHIDFLEDQIELAYTHFNDIYKYHFEKLEKKIEGT